MRLGIILFFLCVFVKAWHCHSQDMLNGHSQLLVVTTPYWEEEQGRLQRYERQEGDGAWVPVGKAIPVVLGRAGLAWGIGLHASDPLLLPCKMEGDDKSPAGVFSLGSAFGFAPDSEMHLKIDYLQLHPDIEAVDDPNSRYYNRIVDNRKVIRDWNSSEKMREINVYEVGLLIEHNFLNPQAGAGSAIFLHIWKEENSGTAGCTAMSRENVHELLSWLEREKKPILVQLPTSVYDTFKSSWSLPELVVD